MAAIVNRIMLHMLAYLMRRGPSCVRNWRLLTASLHAVRHFGPGMATAKVRTRYGFAMKVDLSDWLGQHLFATGDYEPPTSKLVSELVTQNDTVIDVGANCGYFSLLLAKKVGKGGHVFSFEPIPAMLSRLNENIHLNRLQNVSVARQAASDRQGVVDFFVGPTTHLGVSSLRKISSSNDPICVETIPLDSLDFGKRRVSFVKIDVEGAECAVVRGMDGILKRDHPDMVVEVVDRFLKEFGDSAAALYAMLSSHGYRMYEITAEGLQLYTQWSNKCPHHFNAFFTCRKTLPKSLVTF